MGMKVTVSYIFSSGGKCMLWELSVVVNIQGCCCSYVFV